jgi:gliding motility-associated lipoprotein GldD
MKFQILLSAPFSVLIRCSTALLCVALLATACDEEVAIPKPRAYPRVIYPVKKYVPFANTGCPFTFEKPDYAVIERDTSFFGGKPVNDCWFNLSVPGLNAKIYCSYYAIANRVAFDTLLQDAFAMTQKHNVKANYIEETPIHRITDRVHGMVFDVEGPAASSCQFYLTDSTHHFFRGALYFNTQARPDSLAPVIDFMKKDVQRLIGTLKWTK